MPTLIKIIGLDVLDDHRIALRFSDSSHGVWDAAGVLNRDTPLTRPLTDPAYFARVFVEAGALCWPNGLEFGGHALHETLAKAGSLTHAAAA